MGRIKIWMRRRIERKRMRRRRRRVRKTSRRRRMERKRKRMKRKSIKRRRSRWMRSSRMGEEEGRRKRIRRRRRVKTRRRRRRRMFSVISVFVFYSGTHSLAHQYLYLIQPHYTSSSHIYFRATAQYYTVPSVTAMTNHWHQYHVWHLQVFWLAPVGCSIRLQVN